jgi:hypothetical protein
MEGGKKCLNIVLLLEMNVVLPCVRGNFMRVKNIYKYMKIVILAIHFVTHFFLLMKTILTYYVTEDY